MKSIVVENRLPGTGRNYYITAINKSFSASILLLVTGLKMPSDQSTWLVSVPQGHDPQGLIQKLATKLTQQAKLPPRSIGQLFIPSFKVKKLLATLQSYRNR